VKGFAESSEEERIVTFTLPKKDRAKLKDYPQMLDTEITCRLIKVELENGEKEVLCTSLTDDKRTFTKNLNNFTITAGMKKRLTNY